MQLLRRELYHPRTPTRRQLCLQFMPAAITGRKRRKLSQNAADIIPQLLDEQIEQAV